MNRNEYMNELKRRLQKLPSEEFRSVIMYYEEYFDDAGAENEQDAIKNLGTPTEAAATIIGEFATKAPEDGAQPTTKKSMKAIWIALLAVFASPIALPIAIAFAVIIISLGVSLFAILFSLGATGLALLLSGLATVVVGLFASTTFPMLIVTGGCGLIVFAIGILCTMLTVFLFRVSFKGIAKLAGKFLIKKNNTQPMQPQQIEQLVGGNDDENIH